MAQQPETLTLDEARRVAKNRKGLAATIGVPFERWAHNCHGISIKLLKSGAFGPGRVARGTARRVGGQHSWMVLGRNCFDPEAILVDPTLWSYDPSVNGIVVGTAADLGHGHKPHRAASIWNSARPPEPTGRIVTLTPAEPLSPVAKAFLQTVGPLDRRGWMVLANAPLLGWPAGEILAAITDTPELRVFVPIDSIGMVTDRNPHGLYLASLSQDEDPDKRDLRE